MGWAYQIIILCRKACFTWTFIYKNFIECMNIEYMQDKNEFFTMKSKVVKIHCYCNKQANKIKSFWVKDWNSGKFPERNSCSTHNYV